MNFIDYIIKGSLSVAIDTIIYWLFFSGVFERKRSWKNGLFLLIFPISILITSYLGNFGLSITIKIVILVLIGCVVTKVIFQAGWKNIVIYEGIYTLCSVISDSLTMGILSFSHRGIMAAEVLSNYTLSMQGAIISKTLNLIIILVFIKKFGKETNRYSMSEMLIMLLQGVSGIACLMMVFEFSYYKISTYKVSSIYLILVSVLIFASYIVFYNVFESYVKKRNIEQEAMKIQFYNQGQYDYYAALEEENVNIRKMYHDIKNHLLVIQGLNSESAASSELYVQKCLEEVKGYDEFYDTGNELADIIFYEKCNTAKVNNIKTKIMIQKNSLNDLEMLDLCAILTNSFDNAMEACKQCNGERYIQIKTIKNEAAVIITVKNNYEIEPILNERGDFITSKKSKAKHGIGMQSLKMAASKYHGNVEVNLDKDKKEFLLIIMIPIAYQNTL